MAFSLKDGVLTVKNTGAAEVALDEEEAEEAPAEEIDEMSMMMAKQMMGDMKMSFKIEIPGGIDESTASNVDGNTVTMMEMHMGKLLENPENFKKLNNNKPGNAADLQEALKGIEGVKVETKEEITIKLK
jgi:membrane protease subunit (stomatin/prohibitin family)